MAGALLRGRFGSKSRDKTISLPWFDSTAVYGLLGYSDGLLIVSAFDIFAVYKMAVAANGVDAIFWHGHTPKLLGPAAVAFLGAGRELISSETLMCPLHVAK